MAWDRSQYPADWDEVRRKVLARSGGRCECEGECGLHRRTGGPRRCVELAGQRAMFAAGEVVLTTAHLNYPDGPCSCDPPCGRLDHVRAMCARCHLRMDRLLHARHSAERRLAEQRDAENEVGQARLFGESG